MEKSSALFVANEIATVIHLFGFQLTESRMRLVESLASFWGDLVKILIRKHLSGASASISVASASIWASSSQSVGGASLRHLEKSRAYSA